jgi:WD40 repeat protein
MGCGHKRSIECVVTDPMGKMVATGSWDNLLKIWSAGTVFPPFLVQINSFNFTLITNKVFLMTY